MLKAVLDSHWLCVQVSIDLFVTARQSVDLASIAGLCGPTGGQLYHYCPFLSPSDDDQLYNDLRWNVQRPQVCICYSTSHEEGAFGKGHALYIHQLALMMMRKS